MFRTTLLVTLLLWQPLWASEAPVILVVGDSLSAAYGIDSEQGWVALLQQRLSGQQRNYRVVNASQSGATSRGALALLPRALDKHSPAVVIIEIGGNDGLRGLPVAQLQRNLERMITLSLDAGAEVIVTAIRIPPNYGAAYTDKFRGTYDLVSQRDGVTLVEEFVETVALDKTLMLDDGIHPNASAQPLLLEQIWPALEPLLGRKLASTGAD